MWPYFMPHGMKWRGEREGISEKKRAKRNMREDCSSPVLPLTQRCFPIGDPCDALCLVGSLLSPVVYSSFYFQPASFRNEIVDTPGDTAGTNFRGIASHFAIHLSPVCDEISCLCCND